MSHNRLLITALRTTKASCSLAQSPSSLDALTVEWVMQILRLLPIRKVFVVMRVNKKWEAAARVVISEKARLRIGCQRFGPVSLVPELDAIAYVAPYHWERMWKSVLQMDSLQVYECMEESWSELYLLNDDYWPLAVRNAPTLQLLVVPDDFPEQTEDGHEVVFPKLKSLSCRRLTVAGAAACPVLRKIRLSGEQDLEALHQLNMEKMQDLELFYFRLDATNVQPIIALIRQMINLTRLHLFFNEIRDDDDFVFLPALRIFDLSHLLEDVSIMLLDHPDIELMDETIAILVRRNPGLRKVKMMWGDLSDNSLLAFSRLTHLEELLVPGASFIQQVEAGGGVVFPKLKSLSCNRLTVAGAAACPVLTEIRLHSEQDLNALNLLNLEKMQVFQLRSFALDATNVQPIVALIRQMINLTRLRLHFDINQEDDKNIFLPFLRIFDSSHLLEDVTITIDDHPDIDQMNETIETLVRRNPVLRKVWLDWGELTDMSLAAFSRLNHLKELLLSEDGSGLSFTVAGILSLLRGGSRSVLRSFALGWDGEESEIDVLRQEVNQIQTETGNPYLKAKIGEVSLILE